MKATVVIAIYKDIEALDLILKSLFNQSYQEEFEIIVAEDGCDLNVKRYIDKLSHPNLLHTTQEDLGWRKNRSLNNAIRIAKGDMIIFLDGDCIPYSNFVENYIKYFAPKRVLAGRRVELGYKYSKKLRSGEITPIELERNYLRYFFKLKRDNIRRYEEGIKFNHFFYKLRYQNKPSHILGCNFALNREDILKINGFNEDYTNPSVGEDTDIEYRLLSIGCEIKPIRNRANVFHLYHHEKYSKEDNEKSQEIFRVVKEKNEIVCKNGIKKLA